MSPSTPTFAPDDADGSNRPTAKSAPALAPAEQTPANDRPNPPAPLRLTLDEDVEPTNDVAAGELPGPEACADDNDDGNGNKDDSDASDTEKRGPKDKKKRTESSSQPPPLPTIPKVRRTSYEGFKNYYNEEESCYAIEVLEAGYGIKEEVMREKERRKQQFRQTTNAGGARAGITTDEIWIQRVRIQSKHIMAHFRHITNVHFRYDKPRTFFRPFHAFIHYQPKAKQALERLREEMERRRLEPQSPTEKPVKEVKKHVHARAKARARLRRRSLDKKRPAAEGKDDASYTTVSRSGSDDSDNSGPDSEAFDDSADSIPDELLYCQEALDHLQCYVDFVDKSIMPLQDLYRGTAKQRIRYSDLAYLFHPGDVVYSPTQAEFAGSTNYMAAKPSPAVYQPIWKIQYTNPPSISDVVAEEYDKHHRFYISCFYIDFDGKNYGPVKYRFDVTPYEGEIEIKNLPVYPIRFHTHSSKGSSSQGPDRLRPAGKDFQLYVEEKHLYYRGWTLTTSPNGDTLTDSAGEPMKHPEHIDSSVIVDFQAALQALPSWKPTFREPSRMDEEWTSSTDDRLPIILWSDAKRSKPVRRTVEVTQLRDGAHAIETNHYAEEDPFLAAYMAGNTDVSYELSEDNLQLLPGRVMAYVLRDRKFVQLDVHYLSKIEQQSNVFENLKISEQHKEMVMALVDSHFRKKAIKIPRHFSLGQDLIQGKGEGLVILLHGVPGVGKTATAEAVAQSNQQPLFVITCGDLGFTPKEVERSLEEIFRLAHLWDCILLLDEADIFLGERTRNDLKRNALVSVFLRVLEYYSGILFLTTNRVGTLDEAFKSRIHMSLYYPPLDRDQTLQIFQMNIDRIEEIDRKRQESKKLASQQRSKSRDRGKAVAYRDEERSLRLEHHNSDELAHHLVVHRDSVMRFAERHFDAGEQGRWNGRQIRNAFQIASSLAFYDKRQDEMQRRRLDKNITVEAAVLSDKQFEKVAEATLKFERYMTDARGDDKKLARMDRLRADDHKTENRGGPPPSSKGDWQVQTRHAADDDYRGSGRRHGPPAGGPPGGPAGAPRTPQSSGRRDEYDNGRPGYDDARYAEPRHGRGGRYGGDRDFDHPSGSGSVRGSAAVQDFRRRTGGDYESGYSPRSNAGGTEYHGGRNRWGEGGDGAEDWYSDRSYGPPGRAPPSASRTRGGGSGGGDDGRSGRDYGRGGARSGDRTPTRTEWPTAGYREGPEDGEDVRGGYAGAPDRPSAGAARDLSPERKADDDHGPPPRFRDASYHSPPPPGPPRRYGADY